MAQHLSVAAFLPQITSFSYLPHLDDQLEPIWADVLTPAPPTTPSAITHFTTYHPLSDELLSALLSHAPALKQLTVDQIDLLESHRGEQWGLERLRLTNMETPDVSRLALLPTRATGTLQVRSNDAWQIRVSAEEVSYTQHTRAVCTAYTGSVYSIHGQYIQHTRAV